MSEDTRTVQGTRKLKHFIGVAGRARHGKTGFALTLESMFRSAGYLVHTCGFSDPILREAFSMGLVSTSTRENLTRDEIRELVRLGNLRRAQDENYWCRALAREIEEEAPDVAIVHGLRFGNEIEWAHAWGGKVVRLERRHLNGARFVSPDRDPNDPTEASIDSIVPDFEIVHFEGQPDWLAETAKTLARYLMQLRPRLSEPIPSFRSPGGCV